MRNTNTPVVAAAMTVLYVMAAEATERSRLDPLRTPASFQPVAVLSNNNAPSPPVPYPKPTIALRAQNIRELNTGGSAEASPPVSLNARQGPTPPFTTLLTTVRSKRSVSEHAAAKPDRKA